MKKYFLGAFTLIFLAIGLLAALILTQERQEIRKEAVVSGRKGKITLNPQAVTKYPGDRFSTIIKFQTGTTIANALPISSISLRITYPYSGATPELDVVDPDGNPSNQIYPDSDLFSSGDWSFPIKSVTRAGGVVTIDLAAINTNIVGFTTSTPTPLATIYFKANRVLPTNPIILGFNPTLSKMMTKTAPSPYDILDIPVNGSYTIQTDTTPPAAITNLTVSGSTKQNITLSWTTPTDTGPTGKASSYDLRYSTSTITGANWGAATQVSGEPTPADPGISQTFTVQSLAAGTSYYFALKSADTAGNISSLSNIANGNTLPATLSFGFKLQGVTTGGLSRSMTVSLQGTPTKIYSGIPFQSNASGVFTPTTPLSLTGFSIPFSGVTVNVLVKDNNHLRKNLGSLTLTPTDNLGPTTWDSLFLKAADFDNNNILNITDIGNLLSVYTALSVPVTSTNQIYDVNSDNVINITDIALVLTNYTTLEVPGE